MLIAKSGGSAEAMKVPGDKNEAIKWLERAYEQRAFGLFFLKVNPAFDRLRFDDRFKDLLRRIGLKP